jgi:hypothetical protein
MSKGVRDVIVVVELVGHRGVAVGLVSISVAITAVGLLAFGV